MTTTANNPYFDHSTGDKRLIPGDTARAGDVNALLDAVSAGFTKAMTDISLRLPLPEGTQTSIPLTPAARAARALVFGADGNLETWPAIDAVTVSQLFAARDESVQQASAASASANAAEGETSKAQDWATKTGAAVNGTEYSAKEHASGTAVTTGSAKDWATKTGSEVVAGQGYGAKKYANDASASASAAADSAAQASSIAGIPAPSQPGQALRVNSTGTAYELGPAGAVDTPDIVSGSGYLQGESGYTLPAGTQDGQQQLVERLGLFVFRSASTDPVDGETCIAPLSGSGRWLLVCPTWDFVYAWLGGTDLSVLSDGVSQNGNDIAANKAGLASLNARLLSASASLDFPSIAATTGSATLTVTVAGAAVGDRVTLAPPSTLPAGMIPTGYVSTADTVSITLFNNTAGAVDPAAMTWGVTVLKGA